MNYFETPPPKSYLTFPFLSQTSESFFDISRNRPTLQEMDKSFWNTPESFFCESLPKTQVRFYSLVYTILVSVLLRCHPYTNRQKNSLVLFCLLSHLSMTHSDIFTYYLILQTLWTHIISKNVTIIVGRLQVQFSGVALKPSASMESFLFLLQSFVPNPLSFCILNFKCIFTGLRHSKLLFSEYLRHFWLTFDC